MIDNEDAGRPGESLEPRLDPIGPAEEIVGGGRVRLELADHFPHGIVDQPDLARDVMFENAGDVLRIALRLLDDGLAALPHAERQKTNENDREYAGDGVRADSRPHALPHPHP